MNSRITRLQAEVAPHIEGVAGHPLFKSITTMRDLRCFMEHHVFAVWDFMSLLKALQLRLTGVTVPWTPVGDPRTRRLINTIVLDEESDELADGTIVSHLEMYLHAMEAAGANTTAARKLVALVDEGATVSTAVKKARVPQAARRFVQHTMRVVTQSAPHQIAAAFTIGRKEAVPRMFAGIVRDSNLHEVSLLHEYLDRHLELGREKHDPREMAMIASLCGNDDGRWHEATQAAVDALQARAELWHGVGAAIERHWQPEPVATDGSGMRLSFSSS